MASFPLAFFNFLFISSFIFPLTNKKFSDIFPKRRLNFKKTILFSFQNMLQAKNKEKSLNLLSSTLSSLLTFCLLLNLISPLLYLSPPLSSSSSSSFSLSSSTNKKIKILNDETLKNIKGKGIEETENANEEEGEKEEEISFSEIENTTFETSSALNESPPLESEDEFLLEEEKESETTEANEANIEIEEENLSFEEAELNNENLEETNSLQEETLDPNENEINLEENTFEEDEEEQIEDPFYEENSLPEEENEEKASPYLFIQEDEYSCGPASLVTLFSLLLDIKDYSLQKELYQKITNSISLSEEEGSSLFSLKKSAEDLSKDLLPSFSPKAIKTDIETLISEKDTLAPSLIFITPAQNPHFSVLQKIEIKEEEKGKNENQEKDKDLSENENQIEESNNDQTKDENTEEFDQDQTEKENVSQIEEKKENENDETQSEDQNQKDTKSIEENNEKGEKENNGNESDTSSSILFYLLDPYLGEVSLDKEEFSSIFSGVLMYFDREEEGEKQEEENEKEIKEDEAKNEEEIISDDDILNLKGKGKVKWKIKKKRYSSKNKKSFSFEKPTLSLFAWVTNPKPLYLKYIPSTKSYSVAKVPKNSIGIVISKKYIFYNGKLFWFVYFYPLKTQKRKRAYYGWAWQGDLRKIGLIKRWGKIQKIRPKINNFKRNTLVYLKISFITKKLSSLKSEDSCFLLKGTPGKIIGGPKREDVFVWWKVLWLKPKIISWAFQGVLALPKFKKYDRVSPNYKSYNKRKTTLRLYNVASFKKYTSFRAISPSWVGIIVAGPYFNETYVWYHVKWYKSLRFKKFIVRGWVIENYLTRFKSLRKSSSKAKFKRGDKVKVVRVGRSRLRTRAYPSLKARIIDALPLGSIGQILEGPIKANGYTWWKIKWFSSKKKIGWSAENWLEKISSQKKRSFTQKTSKKSSNSKKKKKTSTSQKRTSNKNNNKSSPSRSSSKNSKKTTNNSNNSSSNSKFKIGDKVMPTPKEGLNVRKNPSLSAERIKAVSNTAVGEIIDGPQKSDGYIWWKIKWFDGTIGWSVQDYLAKAEIVPLKVTKENFEILQQLINDPNAWDKQGRLLYNKGGNKLPKAKNNNGYTSIESDGADYYQCVDFAKELSSTSKITTSNWIQGENVIKAGDVQPGTIIATFSIRIGDRYYYNSSGKNAHVAVFIGYLPNNEGIKVIDQNWGNSKLKISKHDIKVLNTPKITPEDASDYYVVYIYKKK